MKMWTTSYGVMTAGWACLMFAFFLWFVDVRGHKKWTLPLVVIGMNAVFIYMFMSIIPVGKIVGVFTDPIAARLGSFGGAFFGPRGFPGFMALAPLQVALVLVIFAIVVAIWRYISLGSIVATAAFPLLVYFMKQPPLPIVLGAAGSALIIIAMHHANIGRLMRGTESKVGKKEVRSPWSSQSVTGDWRFVIAFKVTLLLFAILKRLANHQSPVTIPTDHTTLFNEENRHHRRG